MFTLLVTLSGRDGWRPRLDNRRHPPAPAGVVGARKDRRSAAAAGRILEGVGVWVVWEVWEASGWGIPGKIAATRQVWHILPPPPAPPPTIQCQAPPPLLSLLHFVQRPGASRDFLLLDIALDDWFRTLVERIELAKLGRDDLLQV